ncbi:MAG: phenylalanine--tRNA ligase subunit alpha [Puniceicoccales bacterium]|jgi:phenylalanyl-tRNA synthetase alpha chain|nr:phenylalanine--tRNA ligase subunit alpha [Puniceicoccales bacterium]
MQALGEDLVGEVAEKLGRVHSAAALEDLKASYLGPKGVLREAVKRIQGLDPEERPRFGKTVNHLKARLEDLFREKLEELELSLLRQKIGEPIDITLNSSERMAGKIHPLTQLRHRLEEIFHRVGFVTADGPEIETEWFCFDALNTPDSHPAREVMDTFFLHKDARVETTTKRGSERYLLRSHTSTVQIRTMLKETPPIRVVVPGRVFRRDVTDATHSANFHQCEVLCVDENVTICDLKSILNYFLRSLFGPDTETRMRLSFFPFTEPSFEVDFRSSRLGKLSDRWIEILGCGMVDPNVLEAVGIDPERYSGFAVGFGIERLAMLTYGIDDVRLFYQNDLRFLEQF